MPLLPIEIAESTRRQREQERRWTRLGLAVERELVESTPPRPAFPMPEPPTPRLLDFIGRGGEFEAAPGQVRAFEAEARPTPFIDAFSRLATGEQRAALAPGQPLGAPVRDPEGEVVLRYHAALDEFEELMGRPANERERANLRRHIEDDERGGGFALSDVGRAGLDVLEFLGSGIERPLNMLAVGPEGPTGPEGLTASGRVPTPTGTLIRESVSEEFGRPGEVVFSTLDIGLSPATVVTAAAGPSISAGLRGTGTFGRLAAGFAEPVGGGSLPRRLAAETGVSVLFEQGAVEATERGAHPAVAAAAGFGAAAAGLGVAGAGRALTRGLDTAALRAAEGPLETSVPGILERPARPFRPRIAGGSVLPAGVETPAVVSPAHLGENLLGLRPIEAGLSRRESVKNLIRPRRFKAHEMVSPAFEQRKRAYQAASSHGARTHAAAQAQLRRAFEFDKRHRIPALAGISDDIPGAPTLADVAARLPLYEQYLTDFQRATMEDLQRWLEPFNRLLAQTGVEVPRRPDIMEGGFYIPRGSALKEGAEAPVKVSAGRRVGGRKGFERATVFGSQAEGVEAGFEYAAPWEALGDYVEDAGRRATDQHLANYFATLRDEAGELIAETAADRLAPDLRLRVQELRSQIAGRRATLRAQSVRAGERRREAFRTAGEAIRAEGRAAKAETRLVARRATIEEIDVSSPAAVRESVPTVSDLEAEVERLRGRVKLTAGGNVSQSRENVRLLQRIGELEALAEVRAAADAADDVDTMLAQVEEAARRIGEYNELSSDRGLIARRNLAAARFGRLRRGKRVNSNPFAPGPAPIAGPRETLRAYERALTEMLDSERIDIVRLQSTDAVIRAAERELRVLKGEAERRIRRARAASESARDALRRQADTVETVTRLEDELRGLKGEYERAKRRALQTPREQGVIALPGLQGRTFPDEIANAANRILSQEGPTTGFLGDVVNVANAFNRMYRFMRATLDNSGPGIQGLLGAADDHRAFLDAMKVNVRAMKTPEALGRFLLEFDAAERAAGRLDSAGWARAGVHIGGPSSEFAARGSLLERIPGTGFFDRIFGGFGDTLRLTWARDMLEEELRRGRTLMEIRQSGDLERIADVANGMTGWARDRAFNDIGDLALFAPRFLEARLETLGRAALGLMPGARIDRRHARRAMLRLIGGGTLITVAANEARGMDTDLRPFVDGEYNPDFMRIRDVGGRDFSIFGTYDSLVRAIVLTAQGKPQDALRGMGSGLTTMTWDFLTGETFDHAKVRDSAQSFGAWLLTSMVPFSAEEGLAGVVETARGAVERDVERVGAGLSTALSEMLGLKSSPLGVGDLRDEVAAELFPDETGGSDVGAYAKLNRGQRRQVDEDPRIAERLEEFEDDLGSIEQRVTAAVKRYEAVKAEQEAGLRAVLDGGADPPRVREAISEMKGALYEAGNALFGDAAIEEALQRDDLPIEDVLADAYYSVPLPEDVVTGEMDFDARDRERERILEQAERLGVSREYITGTGPGTYRGQRFSDPVVRQAVEEYEALTAELDASGLFDLSARTWRDVQRQEVFEDAQLYDTFSAWRDATVQRTIEQLRQSSPPGAARQKAENAMRTHPLAKAYADLLSIRRNQWIERHPVLADRATAWDLLRPNQGAIALLDAVLGGMGEGQAEPAAAQP